jgi:putative DNA primase/helicase
VTTDEIMSEQKVLDVAHAWMNRGVPAGPIAVGWDERKQSTTKRPLTRHGHLDFTTDIDTFRRQLNGATVHPGEVYGVGLHLGRRGWFALDVDIKNDARGDDELAELERVHGELPRTPHVLTPSHGEHVWLAKGEAHVGNATFAPGIDVRGDDGWVVAPGTFTPWGRWEFDLMPGHSIKDGDPAPAPEWVTERLDLAAERTTTTERGPQPDAATDEQVAALPEKVRARLLAPAVAAGTRSEEEFAVVGMLVRLGLEDDTIRALMQRNPSSVERGDVDRHVGLCLDGVRARHEDTNPAPPTIAPDGYSLSDVGNAARLVDVSNGRLRYVDAWSKWLVYVGGRWVVDVSGARVTRYAKRVSTALFAQVGALTGEARDKLFAFARSAERAASIASMIGLARELVLVDHEQLDADPRLFNVRNGTVDLCTGELRPHDPDDLITMQARVAFDPEASAPTWTECLETWQPDDDVRAYLQAEAGAGSTGIATQTLSVHLGPGANGKSTYLAALQYVLGEYAVTPHKSLLLAGQHEQHETVKADLFRRRLAVHVESKSGAALDEEQVKAITGGDRMRARRMREDSWFFDPTHTLVIVTNHRPTIHGRDEAIWRRVRLIPWSVTIAKDDRDRDLLVKLKAEAPGILTWMVAGARTFLAEGFEPPDAVSAATAAYRADEDTVGRFITSALELGVGSVASVDLFAEFERWCNEQGVPTPNVADLTAALVDAGYGRGRRRSGGRYVTTWSGVRLAHPPETTSDQQG